MAALTYGRLAARASTSSDDVSTSFVCDLDQSLTLLEVQEVVQVCHASR